MQQQVGSWSLAGAAATILIAQAYHPVMLALLKAGATGAWISALVAGFLAALLLWPAAICLQRIPGGSLIDLARAAVGTPGAIATGILVGGVLILHSGFVIRETAEMAVSSNYPHTPQTFAVVALVLCVLYGAWGGTVALIKLCRLFLPMLLFSVGVVLVGAFPWGEVHYLLPLWGPGALPLLARSTLMTALFSPAIFLLIGAGSVRDRERLGLAVWVTVCGAAALYAVAKAVLIMTFPFPMGPHVTFPMHEMARLILGGRFFERIEGAWVSLWVFGTACHVAAMIHAAALTYTRAFGMDSHRTAVLPTVMMALLVAFFPPDQNQTILWHEAGAPYGLALAFGLPLILAGVAALRRRWGMGEA